MGMRFKRVVYFKEIISLIRYQPNPFSSFGAVVVSEEWKLKLNFGFEGALNDDAELVGTKWPIYKESQLFVLYNKELLKVISHSQLSQC